MELFNSNDMQTIEFCRLSSIQNLSSQQLAYRCRNLLDLKLHEFGQVFLYTVWHLCLLIS